MTLSQQLADFEQWYAAQCDGDWEHASRIRISSLDNPGWSVKINLVETFEAPIHMDRVEITRSENDWYSCWLDGETFNGAGGPTNLHEILQTFLTLVAGHR